eukprot:2388937-Rhodomonas_salina.2
MSRPRSSMGQPSSMPVPPSAHAALSLQSVRYSCGSTVARSWKQRSCPIIRLRNAGARGRSRSTPDTAGHHCQYQISDPMRRTIGRMRTCVPLSSLSGAGNSPLGATTYWYPQTPSSVPAAEGCSSSPSSASGVFPTSLVAVVVVPPYAKANANTIGEMLPRNGRAFLRREPDRHFGQREVRARGGHVLGHGAVVLLVHHAAW